MNDTCIELSSLEFDTQPFPHFTSTITLQKGIAEFLFQWFEHTEEWYLSETDFYEQYEFNFRAVELPETLKNLVAENTIAAIKKYFKATFNLSTLNLVGVMAHKLVEGQKIAIHNDYIGGDETHRLVIHINPKWSEENGGYLMLFNSSNESDIVKVFSPEMNFAFGFEISSRSHHAISMIHDFSRYTLIYTFKNK